MFFTIASAIVIGFVVFGSVFLVFINHNAIQKEMILAETDFNNALSVLNSQMVQVSNIEDDYVNFFSNNTTIKNASQLAIIEGSTIYASEKFKSPYYRDLFMKIPADELKHAKTVEDGTYIMVSQFTSNQKLKVVYFHSLEPMNDYIGKMNQYYRISLIVFIVIAMIVSYIIVQFLINPINTLAKGIEHVRKDRTFILESNTEDEFTPVIQAFNTMNSEITTYIENIEEKQRLQELFLLNFAHEIKTPLTSIIGYAQLIQLKYSDNKSALQELGYIETEGYRLRDISVNLMKLQSTDQNLLKIEPIDISTIGQDLALIIKPYPQCEMILELEDGFILADYELILMCYHNLISNSIKAAASTIRMIGIHKDKDQYELRFIDNGIGMNEKELKRIFEPFYKIRKLESQETSTGLGLYIVQKIVEAHNGTIITSSEPGKGTTVTIILKGVSHEETSV